MWRFQTAQQAYEGRVHDKNMLQSTVSVGTHVRRFSVARGRPGGTEMSWDSPQMLKVKTEWESLYKPGAADQDEYGKLLESLDAVLEKHPFPPRRSSISRLLWNACQDREGRSNFENAVLAYSVRVLVKSGDREDLVKTLSTHART